MNKHSVWLAAALAVAAPAPVLANGDDFFHQHPEMTQLPMAYFGFVKDDRGRGVQGAQVEIRVKGSAISYVVQTNVLGMYRSEDVARDVEPAAVEVVAAKAGYTLVNRIDRTRVTVAGLPVQLDFVLKAN